MKKLTRTLFYALNIIVAAFAKEPSCPVCSRYDYEERLLERALRNEMAMDNLLAEIRQTNAEVKAALNVMKEDKTELATAKIAMQMTQSDMKSYLDDAIQGGLLNISNALSSMTTNTSMAIQQMEKETKIMKGQTVVYTVVEVNEGQGYDSATCRFTVSVPELYAFAV